MCYLYNKQNMKKILLTTAIFVAAFFSCSKKESNEPDTVICPTISKDAVPVVVTMAFQNKYPSDSVITWFSKDSIGYCAYFIQAPSMQKLAEFSNTGTFIQEEIDLNNDGNFEDSTGISPKGSTGCECEILE